MLGVRVRPRSRAIATTSPAPTPGGDASPIAGYPDWPAAVRTASPFGSASEEATALGRLLGVHRRSTPTVVEEERRTVDGVDVRRLRWSVGYGPDTTAWLLRPAGEPGELPGVLGMHCHGGIRSVGAKQLVDLGAASHPRTAELQTAWYGGRAPANELARRGLAVLVHDTFSWGSRRFDLTHPTPRLAGLLAAYEARWRQDGLDPSEDERFDLASSLHEDTLAKAAGVLGQTFTGAVLTDDLLALDVLARQPGVDATRLSTFGFSGGGGRSLLLAALEPRVGAYVVSCMMATFASLVPTYLDAHSWLLHVPGLWAFSDWPDLTRLSGARLLVQYQLDDPLFPADGMAAAHRRLTDLHPDPARYRGTFRPGGHVFDAAMQEEAGTFLAGATPAGDDRDDRPAG